MKTLKKLTVIVMSLCLMFTSLVSFTSCGKDDDATVYISLAKDTITQGETVSVVAMASNGEDCTLSVSNPTLLTISNGSLSVNQSPETDTEVTVTATLSSNPDITASKTITVKSAPAVAPELSVVVTKTTLTGSDYANLTVVVSDGSQYEVTSSEPTILNYRSGNLVVIEEPETDTVVTVTVTTKGAVPATKTIAVTVKAKSAKPTVTITSRVNEISESNTEAELNVAVTNNLDYTLSITKGADYVTLDQQTGKITWNASKLAVDTFITVQATLDSDNTVYDEYNIIVRAKRVEGEVAGRNSIKLTSKMIADIGNASITASGTLTDYVKYYSSGSENLTHVYDMTVKMSDDAWMGQWNVKDSDNISVDNYRKGTDTGRKDTFGNAYHYFNRLFIGKDNEVVHKPVTDYLSQPIFWEEQHLWNHLSELPISKIVNAEAESVFDLTKYGYASNDGYAVFRYATDNETTTMDEWYLLTYFAYSLTPMLSDTLVDVYLVVNADGIVGMIARTEEIPYYGSSVIDDEGYEAGEDEDPISISYTVMNIKFSDVGNTEVPEPSKYQFTSTGILGTAPYEALEQAMANMTGSMNYTFLANEVMTYSPSTDESEYQIDGTTSASGTTSSTPSVPVAGNPCRNQVSSKGQVGLTGYVTEDAILLAKTGKYDYAMDDMVYHTEYSGYKQFDGYYEEFAYSYDEGALHGTKRVSGQIVDLIPQFDFAPEIFMFNNYLKVDNVGDVFTFKLRDSSIARDVAMQLSMDSNAKNAVASIQYAFTLEVACNVDSQGAITNARVVKAVFPYSFAGGTYSGYMEITYGSFGTTVIDEEGSKYEGAFDGYVHREIMSKWSQYEVDDFYWKHSTNHTKNYGCYDEASNTWSCKNADGSYKDGGHVQSAEYVFKYIFGEDNYQYVPQAEVFMEIFGDNINGPWFDYKESSKHENGYADYIEITTSSDKCDENSQITNYDEIYNLLVEKLTAKGYALSQSNTDISGGASGRSNRYVTFISENGQGDIEIVIENNYTRFFWITFYLTGDWTLSR